MHPSLKSGEKQIRTPELDLGAPKLLKHKTSILHVKVSSNDSAVKTTKLQ